MYMYIKGMYVYVYKRNVYYFAVNDQTFFYEWPIRIITQNKKTISIHSYNWF